MAPFAHVLLLGDLDVATPLRDAGHDVTIVRPGGDPVRHSRLGVRLLPRPDGEEALVRTLVEAADRATAPTVLLVQDDHDLALVSRRRDALAQHLGLALPSHARVLALLDKAAFAELAAEHDLPVPPSQIVHTARPTSLRLSLPVLLKPLVRHADRQHDGFGTGKALLAHDATELQAMLTDLGSTYERVLAQQHIPGPERRVETYHAHVASDGTVLAEFTGRKLRTSPRTFGYSTALVTTDAADTRVLGRQVVARLHVRGPAKVDLKRDADDRLWLLEVNARSNLWHRLGAVAGCDLPAVAVADLIGSPLPATTTARAGVTWSLQPRDLQMALQEGQDLLTYLRWLARCDAVSGLRWSDPSPFLRGTLPAHARAAVAQARRRQAAPAAGGA